MISFHLHILVVVVLAIVTNIQAFHPYHWRLHPSNKRATTTPAPGANSITTGRVVTASLREAASDGDVKPAGPLSSLIAGLDAAPARRPKSVLGAGEYDRAAVRSMLEAWISDEKVLVVSSSTCPFCDAVKGLFESKGVDCRVEEIDGRQDVRAELAELVGRSSVPAVFVNGEYIGGCNDGGRGGVLPLQESGELDKLLSDAGALP